MAMNTRARDPDDGTLWKLGAIVLAGVVGWVGHLGGELTYGKSHYKELHQVIDLVVPGWNELGKEAADAEPVASPVGAGDASDEEPSKVADDDSVELTL
jgi:hypothetical protein